MGYVFVLVGFANAFFILFKTGDGFAKSYPEILTYMTVWLLGNPDLKEFTEAMPPEQKGLGQILFFVYCIISVFVSFNLLIAIFDNTFEKVNKNAKNEWLFLRL